MWSGLFMLLGLSIVMGTASFLAGILPLSLTLSPRQLRLITALGTGVLVGTSLIVIIPEGVETLYAASGKHQGGVERRGLVMDKSEVNWASMRQDDVIKRDAEPISVAITFAAPNEVLSSSRATEQEQEPSDDGHEEGGSGSRPSEQPEKEEKHTHEREPHAWIGVAIIFGFILMYLIDTLPQHMSRSSQPQSFPISLNQFSLTRTTSLSSPPAEQVPSEGPSRPSSTTIGLVIHAAADGIALGASSTNSTQRLTFIIFIALMIHKAPAAFGLTSVLLKQGLSKRMARAHLIVFSLAAPVGAIVTWFAAHLLGFSAPGESTEFATGVLLLFSAGTFLYVAMHTMQENSSTGDGHSHGDETNGHAYAGVPMQDDYNGQPAPIKQESGGMVETFVTVGGMLLPLLTQFGHAH